MFRSSSVIDVILHIKDTLAMQCTFNQVMLHLYIYLSKSLYIYDYVIPHAYFLMFM